MSADGNFRSKQLTEAQRNALLDRLDQNDSASRGRDKRITGRLTFRRTNVSLRITQPGGGITECMVATRNLSATGASFLYWGFLHIGTEVRLALRKRQGGEEAVLGHVVWCKHVIGPHHVIGVKFASKIFPKLFVDPADWDDSADEGQFDPRTMRGAILVIDDDAMSHRLIEHHLKGTQVVLTCVTTTRGATDAMRNAKFDLALLDLNLANETGEQAIRKLRDAGFTNPIMLVTAETSPQRLQAAQEAGAAGVLPKPYQKERLLSFLALWLNATEASGEDAIHSALADEPGFGPLILQFVNQTRTSLPRLVEAIEKDQFDTVRTFCQSLKGSGSGFGFGELSDAARDAVKTLDASMSIGESATELQRVMSICRRLAAPRIAA